MAASSVIGNLRILFTANTAEAHTAFRQLGQAADRATRDLRTMGTQASAIGMALTKTLTAPLVLFSGSAVKAAIDFESAFANVAKTVDGVADSSGTLTKEGRQLAQTFRNMAKEIPATTEELSTIAAFGGQMGVPIEQMEKFTKNVAALGVAVDGISTEEAAKGLAQIGNITKQGTENIDKMASALVHLGNSSNATEADILEFSKRLAGAGSTVGMTVPEIMALGTAMADVGINAEAGGTAMSTVINKISNAVSKGGDSLQEFAKVANMSAESFAATWKSSPIQAIDAFVKGLGSMKDRGVDLNLTMGELGTEGIRVADTLKRLAGAGDGISRALKTANEGFAAGNKHLEEAEKKYATTANQLKILWNQIKDVGITIGNALLPTLKAATSALSAAIPLIDVLAKGFAGMPVPLQALVIGFGGLLAAAGPVIYIFGQLALSAKSITEAFGKKGIATKLLGADLGGLRTVAADTVKWLTGIGTAARSSGVLMAGFGAAVAGIVVPAALIIISEHIRKIKEDAQKLEDASLIAKRFISNIAEAERILKAAEIGSKGLTLQGPISQKGIAIDEAKAWMDAKGAAQAYEGQVIKVNVAQHQQTATTIDQVQALMAGANASSKYAGGVIQIGQAMAQASTPAQLLAKAQAELKKATEEYNKAIGPKRDALALEIRSMDQSRKTLKDLSEQYGVSVNHLERLQAELQQETKEHDKAGKAAGKHAEEIKKLNAELSGEDAIEDATNLFKALPPLYKLNEDGLRKVWNVLGQGIAAHNRLGTVAPDAWRDTFVEVSKTLHAYEAAGAAAQAAADLSEEYARIHGAAMDEANRKAQDFFAAMEQLSREEGDTILRNEEDSLQKRLALVKREFDEKRRLVSGSADERRQQLAIIDRMEAMAAMEATRAWEEHVRDVRAAVRTYGSIFRDALQGIPALIQAAFSGGKAAVANLGKDILSGLGSVLGGQAFGDLASKLSGSLFKAFGVSVTSALGKLIPGIGAALGSLIGPLLDKLFGNAGRVKVREFVESTFGSFEKMREELNQFGPAGEELWIALTQGVGRNNPQQAEQIIRDFSARLDELRQKQAQFNSDLNGMLQRVKDLGGTIPDALKPYLDALKDGKRLTQDNLDLIAQLSGEGTVDWKKIEEAANRYGIQQDKLGSSFHKMKLHDAWQQIIDDIDLLQRGGVDVNAVLGDMADEISDLVQDSIKFGTEIPENMRPWIEQLIASGQLLDENGEKITDINRLKFGETLQTSLQKLTDQIKKLIEALDQVPGKVKAIPNKVDVDVNYNENYNPDPDTPRGDFDVGGSRYPEPGEPGYDPRYRYSQGGMVPAGLQYLARGGMAHEGAAPLPATPVYAAQGARVWPWSSRGTDTVPAMLTPGELVLNAAQQRNLAYTIGASLQAASRMLSASQAQAGILPRQSADAIGSALGGPSIIFERGAFDGLTVDSPQRVKQLAVAIAREVRRDPDVAIEWHRLPPLGNTP